jgi:hypothetical protein
MTEAPRVLYDSPAVHAALEAAGRLRIRRDGASGATVCNVSAERVVLAEAVPEAGAAGEAGGRAWLALRGAVARVDFARHEGDAGLVGPFPADACAALASAVCAGLGLPRAPERVACEALAREPERWHERLIESEGVWRVATDASDFAGAWLYPPAGAVSAPGTRRVRLVGFFRCTGSRDFDGRRDGHGPFGLAPAEIDAFEVHPQE